MSRVRADKFTNRLGSGSPTFSEGVNIVGVTSIGGNVGVGSTSLVVNGDARITGVLTVDQGFTNINVSGASTIGVVSATNLTVGDVTFPTAGSFGRRNLIDNGGMRVAQRASSVTGIQNNAEGCRVVDRYHVTFGNGGSYNTVLTGAASSEVPNVGLTSSFKLTVTTNDSIQNNEFLNIGQGIENKTMRASGWNYRDPNSNLVLSFWARTSVGGTYTVSARNWEAFESAFYYVQTVDLVADEWKHNILTIPGHPKLNFDFDNSIGFSIRWYLAAGPDRNDSTVGMGWTQGAEFQAHDGQVDWAATNGATFNLTGVQLEVGDTATPFELRSWDDEIRDCRYFYQKSYEYDTPPGTATNVGAIYMRCDHDTEVGHFCSPVDYKVPMRHGSTTIFEPTLYNLNGSSDRISDCNVAFTHVASETYSDLPGASSNGFAAIDATTTGPIIGFHYTVDAEFTNSP